MLHWAIQFADAIEVLSPQELREQIADTLRNALKKYES
jgi:predicted DNA-binding transcriptional regulator YafY